MRQSSNFDGEDIPGPFPNYIIRVYFPVKVNTIKAPGLHEMENGVNKGSTTRRTTRHVAKGCLGVWGVGGVLKKNKSIDERFSDPLALKIQPPTAIHVFSDLYSNSMSFNNKWKSLCLSRTASWI
jgi:hypothetical protein